MDDQDLRIPKEVLKKGILPALGYKVNKKIILLGFLPSVIILAILFLQYGVGDHWYISCPETRIRCSNSFYHECNPMNQFECCADPKLKERVCSEDPYLCTMPDLPGGFEAGTRPGEFYDWAGLLLWLFPLLAALINHLKYNRNWRRKS